MPQAASKSPAAASSACRSSMCSSVQRSFWMPSSGVGGMVRPKTLRSQRALVCVPLTSTPQLCDNPFHTCCIRGSTTPKHAKKNAAGHRTDKSFVHHTAHQGNVILLVKATAGSHHAEPSTNQHQAGARSGTPAAPAPAPTRRLGRRRSDLLFVSSSTSSTSTSSGSGRNFRTDSLGGWHL